MSTMGDIVKLETAHGTVSGVMREGCPHYVFIHGLGGDSNVFAPVFDHSGVEYRGLLSLDLLGFGSSSRLDDATPYSFALQANAVREALSQAGIEKFVLVLHSMASGLLPEMLKFDELEIETLFLLESNLLEEDAGWSRELSDMSDDEYRVYFQKVQKAARFVMASQLRRKHPREHLQQWSQGYVNSDERAMRETAIELYERTSSGKILDAVKAFDGRKVYFRGIDDCQWNGFDLLNSMGFETVKVPNAGHLLMLDDPEAVYGVIFRDQSKANAEVVAANQQFS